MLEEMLRVKRTKVKAVQKLAGTLNFLCRAIVPGRTFIRRLYDVIGNLPQHYHVNVSSQIKKDLRMWVQFLTTLQGNANVYRSFHEKEMLLDTSINFYTDASGTIGIGCFYNGNYANAKWSMSFLEDVKPSIAFQELAAITTALVIWGHKLKGSVLTIHTDNQSAMAIVNTLTSRCNFCMALVRIIVKVCMSNDVRVKACYIPGKDNHIADALSRFQWERFHEAVENEGYEVKELRKETLPSILWPMCRSKLLN